MAETNKTIWTFGHSTRSQEEFVAVLRSFQIEVLVDVRRYPGSKKYPQFNFSGGLLIYRFNWIIKNRPGFPGLAMLLLAFVMPHF